MSYLISSLHMIGIIPGSPSGYTDTTSCSYTFKKASTDICSIRLEFVDFVTRGPDVDNSPYTSCSYDTVSLSLPQL